MHISCFSFTMILAISSFPALAFSPVTGMENQGKVSGGLLLQDTRYQSDAFFDVEATMLMAAYTAAINPKLSLGGGLGLVVDGELGRVNRANNGTGFRLFFDGAYEIKQFGKSQILGTFGLIRDSFSFKNRNTLPRYEVDFKVTELQFGGLFVHHAEKLSIYGGLDIYLYSNGDVESGNFSNDIDRDDRLSARLGANFPINPTLDLRADLYLLSEQTVYIGADFRL